MNVLSKLKAPAIGTIITCSMLMSPLVLRTNAASIIYTSYSITNTFSPNNGIAINGSGAHFGYFAVAVKFQVTQDASLDSIQVPMWCSGGVDSFIINLCGENNGYPGQVLESFAVSASLPGSIVDATSQTEPLLTTSQDYWLEVLPGDTTTKGAWCDFTPHLNPVSGLIMTDSGSGFQPNIYPPLPFTILGDVPEPSVGSLALLAFALALVKFKG